MKRQRQSVAPIVGDVSPWGIIDWIDYPALGVAVVGTASHGGIWLSPEREKTIPKYLRAIGHRYAFAPWYEEDCDALIPIAFCPDAFTAALVDSARAEIARNPYYKKGRWTYGGKA